MAINKNEIGWFSSCRFCAFRVVSWIVAWSSERKIHELTRICRRHTNVGLPLVSDSGRVLERLAMARAFKAIAIIIVAVTALALGICEVLEKAAGTLSKASGTLGNSSTTRVSIGSVEVHQS